MPYWRLWTVHVTCHASLILTAPAAIPVASPVSYHVQPLPRHSKTQALVNAQQVHVHGSLRRPALPHYGYLTAYATLPFHLASVPPEPQIPLHPTWPRSTVKKPVYETLPSLKLSLLSRRVSCFSFTDTVRLRAPFAVVPRPSTDSPHVCTTRASGSFHSAYTSRSVSATSLQPQGERQGKRQPRRTPPCLLSGGLALLTVNELILIQIRHALTNPFAPWPKSVKNAQTFTFLPLSSQYLIIAPNFRQPTFFPPLLLHCASLQ